MTEQTPDSRFQTSPDALNIADLFLDARIREGLGDKTAIITDEARVSYRDIQVLSNRFAGVLRKLGVEPEQRVLIALPDIPEFPAALFGTLKLGAVVVMVNPQLKTEDIAWFLDYTRARVAVIHSEQIDTFSAAASTARHLKRLLVVGPKAGGQASFEAESRTVSDTMEPFPTHRNDPALWLFSGGTTGRPKAVVQTHASFAFTTECYGRNVIGYNADDITLSVPKLFFGYATGSNLFFPFAAGGSAILFPERCTAEVLFEKIQRHRPTILVNVPTMINQMVTQPEARKQNLGSLRLATSAGEALPVELYNRWRKTFGVELLDGLGTAEMWHIFISNRPGEVKPGTLGRVVPGFEVRVVDDEGRDVPHGEVGWLRVRGGARAINYWQNQERTQSAFLGEWYHSGDMIRRDADGYITYCGRGDDMLKVGGKWLSPQEVENCLLKHPSVKECAVVGVIDDSGLTKPHAFVVAHAQKPGLDEEIKTFVRDTLEPYKAPREVFFVESLPRTHLGKVDRNLLRKR